MPLVGCVSGAGLEVRRSRVGVGVVGGLVGALGRRGGSVRARLRLLGACGCVCRAWLGRGCARRRRWCASARLRRFSERLFRCLCDLRCWWMRSGGSLFGVESFRLSCGSLCCCSGLVWVWDVLRVRLATACCCGRGGRCGLESPCFSPEAALFV